VNVDLWIDKGVKKNPDNYQRKSNLGSQGKAKQSGGKAVLCCFCPGNGRSEMTDLGRTNLLIRSRAAQKYLDILISFVI